MAIIQIRSHNPHKMLWVSPLQKLVPSDILPIISFLILIRKDLMITATQKRLVMGFCAVLLLMPSAPTKTSNNAASNIMTGCLIAAGVLGVCSLAAGVASLFTKTPEQVAQEAEQALQEANRDSHRFYTEYVYAFDQTRSVTLDEIERNFLYPIAERCFYDNFCMESYISKLAEHKKALTYAEAQLADHIRALEQNNEKSRSMYNRLRSIKQTVVAEHSYLDAYYVRLADHRAFFKLYAYEAKLYKMYAYEMTLSQQYMHEPYLFERYVLAHIRARHSASEYPILAYCNHLSDHIDSLAGYLNSLRFYYAGRTPLAQKLLSELRYLRGIIQSTAAFQEERDRKRTDDARREQLALQRRLAEAHEREAHAHMMQAQAQLERNLIERDRLAQMQAAANTQVTVVIPPTTVIVPAPAPAAQTPTTTTATTTTTTVTTGTNAPVYVDYSYWGE